MSTPSEPGPFGDRSDDPARRNRAGGSHERPGRSHGKSGGSHQGDRSRRPDSGPQPDQPAAADQGPAASPLDELFPPGQPYPPDQDYPGDGAPGGEHSYPAGPAYSYPPPPSYDPAGPPPPLSYDPPAPQAPQAPHAAQDPYDPQAPQASYDPQAPQASYDGSTPAMPYDRADFPAPPASPSPYETPPSYDAPPSYDPQPSYSQAPTYDLPPSYEGAPGYDAPPAYGTPPAYGPPDGYDHPGPFGDDPAAYPASAFGTTPPAGPGTQVLARPEPEPEFTYQGAPDDGQDPRVSIVLPCYNEQDHVLRELERISRAMDASGLPYELIAVDDSSTDATLDRLKLAEPNLPRLKVVHFPRNGGAGTVRRIGTQQARGDIVVWTDADMTYPNERIPELVALLDGDPHIDQVVGARTSEEGTHKLARVPAKWFIRKLAEKLTNSEIPDLNSGLRAFRREVALPYLRLLPPGFSCVTTITLAFLSNEHGVRYVPIDYAKRAGVSKFRFVSDAYRYILQVLRMVMYFNPLKVLMPVALFLLGLGILKGIFDMVVHPLYFAINTVLIFVTGLIIASLALLADLIVRSRGDT